MLTFSFTFSSRLQWDGQVIVLTEDCDCWVLNWTAQNGLSLFRQECKHVCMNPTNALSQLDQSGLISFLIRLFHSGLCFSIMIYCQPFCVAQFIWTIRPNKTDCQSWSIIIAYWYVSQPTSVQGIEGVAVEFTERAGHYRNLSAVSKMGNGTLRVCVSMSVFVFETAVSLREAHTGWRLRGLAVRWKWGRVA